MIQEKYVHKAAQLWCLSKHEQKEMDTEFAHSIAKEFESFYNQGRKDAIDEVFGLLSQASDNMEDSQNKNMIKHLRDWLESKLQENKT